MTNEIWWRYSHDLGMYGCFWIRLTRFY
uniref:Uncharacterized protein n=1 Tax=Anguilla anguilla TaxID=7936 RepID=A0A0E9QA28_ANGAN